MTETEKNSFCTNSEEHDSEEHDSEEHDSEEHDSEEHDSEEHDSEEHDSEEHDYNLNNFLFPFNFTKKSGLYVVSIDGEPKFYVKDLKTAQEKMWNIAKQLSNNHFLCGYKTNFIQVSKSEINILGNFKFFIISYDTLLNRISCSKVNECI